MSPEMAKKGLYLNPPWESTLKILRKSQGKKKVVEAVLITPL